MVMGRQWDMCLIYLDDVIVLGRSFEDMVTNLRKVYDRLLAAELKLKAKKCHLFCKKVSKYPDEPESVMIPIDF
jgi:protein-arginine kinase